MKTPDLGRLELRHNHRMLEDRNAELMTLIDRVAQQDHRRVVVQQGGGTQRSGLIHEVRAAAEHQVVVPEIRLRFRPESGAEMGDEQRWIGPTPKQGDGLLIEEGRIFGEHHIGPRLPNGLIHIGQLSPAIGPSAHVIGTGR